jgi:hypothetical protein
MDHVYIVLEGDTDNVVLSEIGSDWGHSLSDHVTFVTLVSVGIHSILVRVDGDCGHGQFMGGSEDSNGNFTSIGDEHLLQGASSTSLLPSQARDPGD